MMCGVRLIAIPSLVHISYAQSNLHPFLLASSNERLVMTHFYIYDGCFISVAAVVRLSIDNSISRCVVIFSISFIAFMPFMVSTYYIYLLHIYKAMQSATSRT